MRWLRSKELGLCLGLWLPGVAAAAPQTKTVLDGVYTTAQAKRGQAGYESKCASCHRADLSGFSGPPLKGALFMDRWREFKLNVLFDLIKTTMPADNPGGMSAAAYLDIQAYILQANDIPAGSKELTAQVPPVTLLVGKDGPKPLPSSSQVEVVGCLTEDSGNGWFLTKAREPIRTLNPWEMSAAELKDAKALPLGDQLFRLENLSEVAGFQPDFMAGNKVDAKGILVRQPKNERINVSSLRAVAATCDE
ncbi:MAG TPA: cytochrome c [Bryobacteraceae bacterium]|jgi:cytochrome c5|nr:cytochrome c [Bryobacteraceae bacterium]